MRSSRGDSRRATLAGSATMAQDHFSVPLKHRLLPLRLWKYVRFATRYRKCVYRGEPELRLIRFLASRDRISVDVGANRGTYTLPLSWYSREVVAFEPHPYMHFLLGKSGLRNTTIHPCALGDRNGRVELQVPLEANSERPNLATIAPARSDCESKRYTVALRTLDSFELTDVGFIKIDVEGAELNVLRGALETIRASRPVVLCEILDLRQGEPDKALEKIAFLTDLGHIALCIVDGSMRAFDSLHESERRLCRNFVFLPSRCPPG